MTTGGPTAFLHDSSWDAAKRYVQKMGNFNNALTQVTRVLERDKSASEEVDPTCYFMMRTLLAHHRIRANIYFAVLTLYPEEFDSSSSLTAKALITKLKRSEHSAIASSIFAYHLTKRLADEEHVPELDKDIQEFGEVGMISGRFLPNLSIAKGLILGSIRHLAFAIFSGEKSDNFSKYKSTIRKEKVTYNLNLEKELFGCQHSQIASLIIQKLGFKRSFAQDCYLALATNIKNISREAKILRETVRLVDLIMVEEDIPQESQIDFELLGQDRASLLEPLKGALKVRTTGSLYAWMSKTDTDINAENNPDLFEEPSNVLEDNDFDFSSVPESVRQEFSMEDFASFRNTIAAILDG